MPSQVTVSLVLAKGAFDIKFAPIDYFSLLFYVKVTNELGGVFAGEVER